MVAQPSSGTLGTPTLQFSSLPTQSFLSFGGIMVERSNAPQISQALTLEAVTVRVSMGKGTLWVGLSKGSQDGR